MAVYAALAGFGLYLRVPGFDPASFSNDDSWLAIAIRDMSWSQFLTIRPPVPIGFRFVQNVVGRLSADFEWPLQIAPIAASLALAVLAGLLAAHVSRNPWSGPVAMAWALVSPAWIELGVRPKQYATDGLVTVVLVLLAVRLYENPTASRVRRFLWAGVAGLALSFPALFVIGPALLLALTFPDTRSALARRGNRLAIVSSTLALCGLLVFMHGQSSDGLRRLLAASPEAYVPTDSIAAAVSFVAAFAWRFLSSAFPAPLEFLAFGVGIVLLARPRDRGSRTLSLLVLGIFVALALASVARFYPVSPGRLSAFHRPLPPVVLALGVHAVSRAMSRRTFPGSARALFLLAVLAPLPFAERSAYPAAQDAQAAWAVAEVLQPDDTVIAFRAAHALGYYYPGPRDIVRTPLVAAGFLARLQRPNVHYLMGSVRDSRSLQLLNHGLDRALDTATERIVFVQARFGQERARIATDHMLSRIEQAGYAQVPGDPETKAFFVVLERNAGR